MAVALPGWGWLAGLVDLLAGRHGWPRDPAEAKRKARKGPEEAQKRLRREPKDTQKKPRRLGELSSRGQAWVAVGSRGRPWLAVCGHGQP